MKYIITKQQEEKLESIIIEQLNSKLTPFGGWNPKKYKEDLNHPFSDSEIFISLEDLGDDEDRDADQYEHIFYSRCDNPNYEYEGNGDCPEVVLDSLKWNFFQSMFGDIWQPIFLKWFEKNSKLPVARVRHSEWD